ncbi:MAG: hypothetical protein J2P31_11080 [Blastocatellia bacterium]|nr:hypothetical protein [Blastocatellia bacterium]
MLANIIFTKEFNFYLRAIPLILLLAASPVGTAFSSSGVDLSGLWKLNKNESDDTKEKIEQSIGKRGGGRLGGGMRQKRISELLENVQAPETLEIKQEESQITITRAGGRARTFKADGSTQKFQTGNGKTIEMSATRRAGQLEFEIRPEGRSGKISEAFTLAGNGRKLNVTIRIEGERLSEPIVIHRVYDAAGNQ